MDQTRGAFSVDLLAESRDLDVDDVVERCGTARLFPDFAGKHFARYEVALVAEQVFEKLEFARRQIERSFPPVCAPSDEIHLQIRRFQPEDVRRAAAPQQRPDSREQLGERERFDQIVVGAEIEPDHAIVYAVARRQDEDRRLDTPLPERLQDFQTASAGKHQVQNDKVEDFSVGAKEPVLARRRHHDVVMRPFQRGGENLGDFSFVFNNEDTHQCKCYWAIPGLFLTFVSDTLQKTFQAPPLGSE